MPRAEAFTLIELLAVSKRKRCAFTLIELLVVVAIVALLISLLLPSVMRAQELANRVGCASNMRTVDLACLMYAGDNDGWPPRENRPGYAWAAEHPTYPYDAAPYWGGRYGGGNPLSKQPWWGKTGCPSYHHRWGGMNMGMAFGVNTRICAFVSPGGRYVNFESIDIPSEMLLMVENIFAYQPGNFWQNIVPTCRGSRRSGGGQQGRHMGDGLNFGFLDGHVRWFGYYRDPASQAETFLPRNPRYTP